MNVTYSYVAEEVEEKPTFIDVLPPKTSVVFKKIVKKGVAEPSDLIKFANSTKVITSAPEVLATAHAIELLRTSAENTIGTDMFFALLKENNPNAVEKHDEEYPRVPKYSGYN